MKVDLLHVYASPHGARDGPKGAMDSSKEPGTGTEGGLVFHGPPYSRHVLNPVHPQLGLVASSGGEGKCPGSVLHEY